MLPPRRLSRVIVLATSRSLTGGVEQVTHAVTDALARTGGVEVHLLGLWDSPMRGAAEVSTYAGSRPLRKLVYSLAAISSSFRLRPAAVIATHLGLAPLALLVGLLARSQPVVLLHGREAWSTHSFVKRTIYRRCRLVAMSAHTREQAGPALRLHPSRIERLRHALPRPREERLLGLTPSPTVGRLLVISRLQRDCRYKGVDSVVQAMPAILREVPRAHLVVIGDGDDRLYLESLASTLGVTENVSFLGKVADDVLLEELRMAAVVALPSRSSPTGGDGFGLALLEAALAGVPGIAGQGGTTETVSDQITGMVIPEPTPPAVARVAARLLLDPEGAAQMGRNARRQAQNYYSSDRMVESLSTLLVLRHPPPEGSLTGSP